MATSTHNAGTATNVIGLALLGQGPALTQIAAHLTHVPDGQIVGQAGMPQTDKLDGPAWFGDARVLIAEPAVKAAILAGSTRQDVAHARLAIERGIPVWRRPPLARTFPEAVELCKLVRQREQLHHVMSWWSLVAESAWQDIHWPAAFDPTYSEVTVAAPGPNLDDWEANQSEAAGGVLANNAYPFLEALIALRGLPENTSATIAHLRTAVDRPARETEDTAVAILRYPDERAAALRAAWDLPPHAAQLTHFARGYAVQIAADSVTLSQHDGTQIEEHTLEQDAVVQDLRNFLQNVREQATAKAPPLEQHLAVSALLEATYLAARTTQPESIRKLYDMHGWPTPR
jgi:predicted dehydrogenase